MEQAKKVAGSKVVKIGGGPTANLGSPVRAYLRI